MTRSEFLNGAKLPDNELANELFEVLERVYMDSEAAKPLIYEAGYKLYELVRITTKRAASDMYRKTLYELNEAEMRIMDRLEDIDKC